MVIDLQIRHLADFDAFERQEIASARSGEGTSLTLSLRCFMFDSQKSYYFHSSA
jgi:hypothetical protein